MTSGLLLLADSRLPSGGHGHSGGVEALIDRGLLRTEADLGLFLEGRVRTGGLVPAAAAAAACALAGSPHDRPGSPHRDGGFADPSPGSGAPAAPARGPQHRGSTAIPPVQGDRGAASGVAGGWRRWDAAVSARMPSAALRAASRAQGSALLRTVSLAWPGPAVDELRELGGVHHPLVLGVAAAGAGATPEQAAALALHHLVGGACSAAVRLLGLDPLAVAAVAAAVGRVAEPVAADAARIAALAVAADDPDLLPVEGSPLHDVLAQLHHSHLHRPSGATLFAS